MWFKRHFLSVLGSLALLPSLWKGFTSLLSMAGDIDLVIERGKDPGWMGQVIHYLLDPPSWSIVPSILIGLLLIWYDFRRSTMKTASAGAPPSKMQFSFADDLKSHGDPFFVSNINYGVEGHTVDTFVGKRMNAFGLTNMSDETLIDLQAFAVRVRYGSGSDYRIKVSLPLMDDKSELHPKQTIRFRFLSYYSKSLWIISPIQFVDEDTIGCLNFISTPGLVGPVGVNSAGIPDVNGYGIMLPYGKSHEEILIDVCVYGLNILPTYCRFSVRNPDNIAISLAEQGIVLSEPKDKQQPSINPQNA